VSDINFIGNISLGKVQVWEDKKAASMTPISFPGKDAGLTEAIDTLGVIAYINFSGRWTGSFKDIQSYIMQIKSIADGQQTSAQALRSPFVNSTDEDSNVKVGLISTNTGFGTNTVSDTTSGVNFTTRGIVAGDIVKNLISGETATIVSGGVAATTLTLDDNIFSASGITYAVTATVNCKVLSIDARWELPGLTYCNYQISVVQVR